jgi:predicted proteasome-type protease
MGVGGYEEALRHSVALEFPFGTCRLLDLDTLIKSKIALGRPHDLLTVEHLKAVKSQIRGEQ